MKDRQFTVILALAIAAGLVMGLVAFRTTGGSPASSAAAAATATTDGTAPNNLPPPTAADEQGAGKPAEINEPLTSADAQDGGPSGPVKDPPPMQAQLVGDAPAPASSDASPQ